MSTSTTTRETRKKVEQPAKAYSDPKQVVADTALSKQEKRAVLNSLEQDARQLAIATAEGMAGGEETKLRNVLQAKRALDATPADQAFSLVLRTLEEQLKETLGTDAHGVISDAIDAIHAARRAMAERAAMPTPPPGAPEPGSTAELQEELDKEKLDPGA